MARLRGWAPIGERLHGERPHSHWRTMTILAALRHDRVVAPWLLDGPINGERFRLYVEQILVPALKPGDIVIMDNLGSHKGKAIRAANLQASAATVSLTPPAKWQPRVRTGKGGPCPTGPRISRSPPPPEERTCNGSPGGRRVLRSMSVTS